MFHDRSSLSRLVALLEDFWWQWQLLLRQGRSGSGKSELQTPSESSSPSALAKRPAEADLQWPRDNTDLVLGTYVIEWWIIMRNYIYMYTDLWRMSEMSICAMFLHCDMFFRHIFMWKQSDASRLTPPRFNGWYRSKGDVTWFIDSDNIQKDPIISNHYIQKYRPKYTISPTISNSQQYPTIFNKKWVCTQDYMAPY